MTTDSTLSQEAILAQLGATIPSAKPSSRFLTAQTPLFSLPCAVVYLQGVLPLPPSPEEALGYYLAHSKVRLLAQAKKLPPEAQALVSTLKDPTKRGLLYSAQGKDYQLTLVRTVAEYFPSVDPGRCLSKAFALSAIEAYTEGLADFLIRQGLDSPEAYLAKVAPTTKPSLASADLNSLTADWD